MILISYELDSKILHYKTKRQKYDFFHQQDVFFSKKSFTIDSSGKVIKNMRREIERKHFLRREILVSI